MSKNKEYFVLIDTNKDTDLLVGVIKKNDTNVELKMTLMQNGQVYDLTDASYITITVGKPDGNTNNGYAEITDPANGQVKYLMPINVTNLVGEYTAELQVYVADESFSTATIAYTVKESLLSDEGVTQAENYPILTQLVGEVTALKNTMSTAENLRVTAENIRQSNELTRETNETARKTAETTRVNEFNDIKDQYNKAISSTSNLETVEARKDLDNVVHEDLKTRLNADAQKVKTIENKINKKDQLSVSLSPTTKVASVTNAYGGACGFEVEGALVENLVKNGDFSDGTTGWITVDSTNFKVTNRIAKFTATTKYGRLQKNTYMINGRRYALVSRMKANSNRVGASVAGVGGIAHSGSNKFEIITSVFNWTPASAFWAIQLWDDRTSGWSEVEVDWVMVIDITGEIYTADDVKNMFSSYFEGLQPLRGVAVEAVGKNLFDIDYTDVIDAENVILKDNWTAYEAVVYDLKPNTSYTVSGESVSIPNIMYVGVTNGYKTLFASSSTGSSEIIIITGDNGKLCFACTHGNVINAYSTISNVMLRETQLTDDTYEPYKSSKVVFEDALAKLPNGIADKIVRENGKTIKYVNTNVGRDGNSFKVDVDSIVLNSEPSNVNHIYIPLSKLKDVISQGFGIGNNIRVNNAIEVSEGAAGSVSSIGKFFTTISQLLVWVVSKTEITTIEQAKSYMLNTEIVYQLATPQTIELTDQLEPLNSYEDYTQFNVSDGLVEGEKANVSETTNKHHINGADAIPDSPLKHKTDTIINITYDGKKIIDLGDIRQDNAHGVERWQIDKTTVTANNIDINQIYVTYTTSETNGQANAKITYNADMSSAVSSNANAINAVGEQTDRNTKDARNQNLINLEFDVRLTALES